MIGPLSYIGGKRRLAKRIVALIPPHTTYVEPFAGGAQVFYAKPPSTVEVLNDLDSEIVNFLRCCQLHHEELIRYLSSMVSSRTIFELYTRQDPETLTDVQRAARFLYLQKNAFGGKRVGRTYNYGVTRPPNFNPARLPAVLRAAAKRLERVQLENWPYEKVLERFDRPSTYYYLDPPYVGVRLYHRNLADEEFAVLADRLAHIQGKFLLSINDCALAREVFARFQIHDVSVVYTARSTAGRFNELLVSNYDLPRTTELGAPAIGSTDAVGIGT